jgi:hypothetical protein
MEIHQNWEACVFHGSRRFVVYGSANWEFRSAAAFVSKFARICNPAAIFQWAQIINHTRCSGVRQVARGIGRGMGFGIACKIKGFRRLTGGEARRRLGAKLVWAVEQLVSFPGVFRILRRAKSRGTKVFAQLGEFSKITLHSPRQSGGWSGEWRFALQNKGGRSWAVWTNDELLAVTVYRKGAFAIRDFLAARRGATCNGGVEPEDFRECLGEQANQPASSLLPLFFLSLWI